MRLAAVPELWRDVPRYGRIRVKTPEARMSELEELRRRLITAAAAGAAPAEIEQSVHLLEEQIRRDERKRALADVRHTVNTLRSLTAFLRQELEHSIEPLASICDEFEREAEPPAQPGP